MTFQGVACCEFRCELPLQDSNLDYLIQSRACWPRCWRAGEANWSSSSRHGMTFSPFLVA